MGDFGLYDSWIGSRYPRYISTINCSLGGDDSLYGGEGAVDYIVGGSLNDKIFADDMLSTNGSNVDIVFGDHAYIMFYEDESHRLQEAVTIDVECNGGNDEITLGPGDDLVSSCWFVGWELQHFCM